MSEQIIINQAVSDQMAHEVQVQKTEHKPTKEQIVNGFIEALQKGGFA